MTTPVFSTLTELLAARAAEQPARRLFTHWLERGEQQQTLTLGELESRARAVAAHLKGAAKPGERAVMLYTPGLEPLPAFFGALYAGLIPLPVIPPRPNQPLTTLKKTTADAQTNLILTTENMRQHAEQQYSDSGYFQMFRWVATDMIAQEAAPRDWQPAARDANDPAVLMYTSGSTNFPKGVVLTQANILSHLRAANEYFKPGRDEHMIAWMPLHHASGLVGSVLHPLYSNVDVTILSPLDVVQRPAYWLEAISRTKATISSAPNFLYQACVDRTMPEERATLDLGAWRFAFSGAEPIRATTLERFGELFAPCGFRVENLYAVYGQSETTLITTVHSAGLPPTVTLDRAALQRGTAVPAAPGAAGQVLVSCGQPIVDTTVRIVEPVTRAQCGADKIGEIWIAGPTVARGYWNNVEATAEMFHAYVADTGEGPFFRSGDLGFWHDGELYIAGRLKDMIIVRGKNYYSQDIEAAVADAHPALRGGSGAAFGVDVNGTEEIVLMHEVKAGRENVSIDEIAEAVRGAAARALDVRLYAVAIVAADSLPRTPTGKIQRFRCREEFLNRA